jgi:hypothetical protein
MSALLGLFLNPAMLALSALLPLVVFMYLLKLKRRPVRVPSTLLWRRAVEDMAANAPFQRLRNNLLLWLQLLVLLLLILALARPVFKLAGGQTETTIVLLDMSASMQARDADGRTRFDAAREQALRLVDDLGSGGFMDRMGPRQEIMVIGIAERALSLVPQTSDRGVIRSALRELRPRDVEADLADLGFLLEPKTRLRSPQEDVAYLPNPDVRVVLLSDGRLGDNLTALTDLANLDYTPIGTSTANVGFTAVDVRESFAGRFQYQVFASLLNAGPDARTVYAELQVAGEVVDLKRVDLPAAGRGQVVYTIGEDIRGVATLRLVDHTDDFPADDIARAVIAPPVDLKILIVTRGNPFLERVFSIDPRARVSVMRPNEYAPRDDVDIHVFDNWAPPAAPPTQSIYINAVPADLGYGVAGDPVRNPRVIDWSRVHPLTPSFINFERVLIGQALRLTTPPAAVALVEAVDTDLLSVLERDTRSTLVIGFDITESYWPLDVSFPMFFGNLIDQWSRRAGGLGTASWRTGSTIPIIPPRDAASTVVTTPTGRRIEFSAAGQSTLYLTDTHEAGLYTVRHDTGAESVLAVNLFSELESDLTVARDLEFGGRTIRGTGDSVRTNREIWHWLVLAGLGFLLVEWAVYTRRMFM